MTVHIYTLTFVKNCENNVQTSLLNISFSKSCFIRIKGGSLQNIIKETDQSAEPRYLDKSCTAAQKELKCSEGEGRVCSGKKNAVISLIVEFN